MDALTAATSFGAIIGLLCNYMSEARADASDKNGDFIRWLDENHHTAIKQLILENRQFSRGLEILFQQGRERILNKLDSLDKALAAIALQFDGFKEVATALKNRDTLSSQALVILQRFYESEGTTLLEMHFRGHTYFQIMDGRGGNIEIEDERFLEDDLKQLCEFELLLPDRNKSGNRIYRITRNAASFWENIKQESVNE